MHKLFENKKIAVVIPHHKFVGTDQKTGGHISHFKGVVKGFIQNGCTVTTFVKDPKFRCINLNDSSCHIDVKGTSRLSYLFNLFWRLFRLRKTFDLIYIRHSLGAIIFYPLFFLIFQNSKKVLELNSFTAEKTVITYFEKYSLHFFDNIIAISETLKQSIPDNIKPITSVVSNGVDLDRFHSLEYKSISDSECDVVFGFIGSLKSGYGIEKLLDMYVKAEIKSSILRIAGNGELLSILKNKYREVPTIDLVGQIEFDAVPDFLDSCDILVYPGDSFINFQSPLKIYEYLASGKPILAANVNGIDKILDQSSNQCGLIFDHDSPKDFIEKAKLLAKSKILRKKLGKNAKIASKKHSWSSRVQQMLSLNFPN